MSIIPFFQGIEEASAPPQISDREIVGNFSSHQTTQKVSDLFLKLMDDLKSGTHVVNPLFDREQVRKLSRPDLTSSNEELVELED